MSAFDAVVEDTKDRIAKIKHLRVEKLVKLQSKPCGVCHQPVVYAVVSSLSGKRLPIDVAKVLNNSLKVVLGPDDEIEVWPFTPGAHRCPSPTVYRSLRELLTAHPDLRELHEARGRAALARHFQASKLDKAKAEWDKALAERNILLRLSLPDVGFGAGFSIPDGLEPGDQPIDRNRFGNAAEEQAS